MEECKNSVATDCQAVDTPYQEADIKRPPPEKPLMKPVLAFIILTVYIIALITIYT